MSGLPTATEATIRLRTGILRSIVDGASERCPTCGQSIDVSEVEPLALVTCPSCNHSFVALREFTPFTLQKAIGHGEMGVVYRAMDKSVGRVVALKLLRDDISATRSQTRRFEADAALLAPMKEPNIANIYSASKKNGHFCIASEIILNGSLQQQIQQQGRLPEQRVLSIMLQAVVGLRAAYLAGVLHRNLKPSNLLFTNEQTVKLTDFGLAFPWEPGSSEVVVEHPGCPDYLSPERVLAEKEDIRSDIYSLGAVFYHALSGELPFSGATPAIAATSRLHSDLPSIRITVPAISQATEGCLQRMLARDPQNRYQTYEELILALKFALEEHAEQRTLLQQRTASIAPPIPASGKRFTRFVPAALAILAIGALATIAAMRFLPDRLTKGTPTPVEEAARASDRAAQFSDGRQLLVAGLSTRAASVFKALEEDQKTPEPMRQWAIAQEGLSHFFDGQLPQARETFFSMQSMPFRGIVPDASELNRCFTEMARWGANDLVVPVSVASEINKNGPGALALLVFGMKNWELGSFDEAAFFLEAFMQSTPSGNYAWIRDYRALATSYLADYSAYSTAIKSIRSEGLPLNAPEVTTILTKLREDLHHKGKLVQYLDSLTAHAAEVLERELKQIETVTPEMEKIFQPIDLRSASDADVRHGLFQDRNYPKESLRILRFGKINGNGILFDLPDPEKAPDGKMLVILKGGSGDAQRYPQKIVIDVPGIQMKKLHVLGGVAGWGWPFGAKDSRKGAVIVKLSIIHKNGQAEVTNLENGVQIVDYRTFVDVEGSTRVAGLVVPPGQLRTFAINVENPSPVVQILLEGFNDQEAPLFAAMTAEIEPAAAP